MKLPKLCRSNSAVAVAVAVPVEQADASQARFEALMRSNFHNPDPLHNVKPDSQGYKWPGHVVSQAEDLGNVGFALKGYLR